MAVSIFHQIQILIKKNLVLSEMGPDHKLMHL